MRYRSCLLLCAVLGLCVFGCSNNGGQPLPPAMPGAPCVCDPTSPDPNSCMQAYTNPQICPDIGGVPFCSRHVGSENTFDILLFNRGLSGLIIDSVHLLGDDNCSFYPPELSFRTTEQASQTGQDATIFPYGHSESIHLTYRPSKLAPDFAVLRIESNAENFKQLDIAVCGQGELQDAAAQGPDGGMCLACMKPRSDTPACASPDGGP